MTHREFKDQDKRRWDVWDVLPSAVERSAVVAVEASEATERRGLDHTRSNLPLDLRQGWLAFQSGSEVRRLAPIPPNWELLSDAALERLARSAPRVGRQIR